MNRAKTLRKHTLRTAPACDVVRARTAGEEERLTVFAVLVLASAPLIRRHLTD
ncbi:hypothetical protein AB0D99_22505 [Streptomyces sp. NPDC047971]|uniref:hypothetical protein n=1 Tax=Streptomyces sp. NPDC047971 TaxID=3154499 RepID=UPI0033FAEA9F